MKRVFSLILIAIMVLAFVGCSDNAKSTASDANESKSEKAVVRLGGLKGPTSMGMVKLLEDNENGKTANNYIFTMAGSADELTPKILQGELDILAVPANLGSVLFNKSNGAVKMIAVNMLGAIYIVEKNGNTINSLSDLKGKTIYATGKGMPTAVFPMRTEIS